MNIYRISRSVADDLRDLMVVHQRFRTSTSPESVYILFGTRRTDGFTTVESLTAVKNTTPDTLSRRPPGPASLRRGHGGREG